MKCGMTHLWDEWGERVVCTVVEVQDLQARSPRPGGRAGAGAGDPSRALPQVVQVKREATEGFNALKLGALAPHNVYSSGPRARACSPRRVHNAT